MEVELGPGRSIVSGMHEQHHNDSKRHSDRHDVIAALKEGVVNLIVNAINFEEIKARVILVVLRNESRTLN